MVRVAFRAPELGGFSIGRGVRQAERRARRSSSRREQAIDNGLLEAGGWPRRHSSTLADTRSGFAIPTLLGLESDGDAGDTYTYAPRPATLFRPRESPGRSPRSLAAGPLVGALEARGTCASAAGGVRARLTLALHAGSPLLRCTLDLDNRAAIIGCGSRIPTGVPGDAGGRGGTVRRRSRRASGRSFDAAQLPA